jgi:CRP-like cAMP-binding protein
MEYFKFMHVNKNMVIEVNSEESFKYPDIPANLQEVVDSIDYDELMEKTQHRSEHWFKVKESFIEKVKLFEYKFKYLRKVSVLGDGTSFGELALITDMPRAASIITTCDSHFAILNRKQFDEILSKAHEDTINKQLIILDQIPNIKQYSKKFKTKITCNFNFSYFYIDFMEILEVCNGKIIYDENDKADDIYYVLEGSFESEKVMHTYKTDESVRVEFMPFEPSPLILKKYAKFWEENERLCQKPEDKHWSEIQKFYNKPIVDRLRLCITNTSGFIGLGELMMQDSKRFTKVTCTTKYAKILKINAGKLFKKLNDPDTINEWQLLSLEKFKMD